MPKRTDLKKICIIGAGPIVIGQACEFDYSGTQACKALREEGYEVVLINSNPATIMTDPETANRTYIEPVTPEYVAAVLRRERPDALLPTLGGQTALNTAFKVAETGVLKELGIEMIGADRDVIHRAEDRDAFRSTMMEIGMDLPRSALAHTMSEAAAALEQVGLPCVIRPAFTLGGTGGGIAYNRQEFEQIAADGLAASMVSEILIEESLEGWKEFEMELMRDRKDNVVIVCSIENLDPMGVHTGDSITVAPVQTMTDREYQKMRDDSFRIIRAIGVETGGCNIQFAQNPDNGRLVVIEMNPRVSRSSALASKATGFPIAKIAAKVAVGYTLDEIPNDITQKTPACFEPSIDYCVVKIPRFAFEKFPGGNERLTIQMKSVGEAMAIGRTFKEALQKGIRSMEIKRFGLGAPSDADAESRTLDEILLEMYTPSRDRLFQMARAFRIGATVEQVRDITKIDPWYLRQIKQLVEEELQLGKTKLADMTCDEMRRIKRLGFSDRRLGEIMTCGEQAVRRWRLNHDIDAVCKLVDTCGAEFEAMTPYYYSTYEEEDETDSGSSDAEKREKILILGGGPNRIGQGIEFDYCCCHAAFAVRDSGYEAIMMNCNPETVSTDYDTSDRLYFEPLTLEDVLGVVRREKPKGVILQFGGQTPLNIAQMLADEGVPILGTSVASIAAAEDRNLFSAMLEKLNIRQTPNATAIELGEAVNKAAVIGYPVLMRPSFVLGGAKMEIVFSEQDLREYWQNLHVYCMKADVTIDRDHPILIDHFLENATEIDVDALCDGERVYIAGVMEHIEEAGIHSGDSACSIPPQTLPHWLVRQIEQTAGKIAFELKVRGLVNLQLAVKNNVIYVLEVNPRASRTVPFVSKVTGVPIAQAATKIMLGETLDSLGIGKNPREIEHVGVKESVFPWTRFPGVDIKLGPEMKSTGEVMGIDRSFDAAFAKSQIAAGLSIPQEGNVFISVKDSDKPYVGEVAGKLRELGFHIIASRGTAAVLSSMGIAVRTIAKIVEGARPNILDLMIDNQVQLIINTPSGKNPHRDEVTIRSTCIHRNIPLVTTIRGARAWLEAIRYSKQNPQTAVTPIQDYL
ncbi:MAG: carbamoyl-phosphate synthase large subunit [Planctomycetaceae bacterium]|jgi:carbamoyl-phosphate synthase large subunit|nr:carbamoyl-phosphate synthase large subunit [Planctomycetaceae bacterium]